MKRISVIGLGKLGLPWAVCLASKDFKVIGVDIDDEKIAKINKGISPIHETDLQKYLSLQLQDYFQTSYFLEDISPI